MRNTMEQSSLDIRQQDETDFSLKEWALKAKINRTNTSSRRFSESNLKSFGENAMSSFRSNITSSSTASSPAGYTLRGEIDPSTYSFTTALKALQAKTVYTWEYLSPDGLTLNSKWNDAERYICNPLSGQVPIECLSAKTLSERSFRSRITMSAPLIYPASSSMHHAQYAESPISEHESEVEITSQEKKKDDTARDMGTQSMSVDHSSSSLSPAPTPSIEERSVKIDYGNSSVSTKNLKSETEVEEVETRDKQKQYTKRKKQTMPRCSYTQRGCISLRDLWMRTVRKREDHKTKNKNC